VVEARRTAVVKLDTSPDECNVLRETSTQFNDCANSTVEWCWHGSEDNGYHVTNKRTARDALYRDLKNGHDLTANLVQASITRTVEAIRSGVAKLKRGERTSRPHFTAPSIV
jgi:hypothetical protein